MNARRIAGTVLAAAVTGLIAAAGPAGAEPGRKGTFEGKSGHVVTGTVSIERAGSRWFVRLADDFRLDRAPDPRVALGKDGYDESTTLSRLKSRTGSDRYQIPDRIDPARYNEVWIWCKKFEVPLALAKLR